MFYVLCLAVLILCAIINRVRGSRPFGQWHHRNLASLMYLGLVALLTLDYRYALVFGLAFWISSMLGWAKWQSCGMKANNQAWLDEDARRPVPFYNWWCELFAPKPFDGDARKKMGQSMEIWTDCHCMSMRMSLVFLPMAFVMSFLIGDWYIWFTIAAFSSAWMGLSYYLGTWNVFIKSIIEPVRVGSWDLGGSASECIGGLSWAFPLMYLLMV